MSGDGIYWAQAPAKINWTLEVLAKRGDGYHEVRSVMQTLLLADTLELRFAPTYQLTVDGLEAAGVPEEGNLVTRAASSFPRDLAARPVAFHLTKNIPAAAGLGGGSSDAAAALRLLHRVWQPRPAIGRPDIREIAAALGSDVPFFLDGGVQLISGRGEIHEPLPTWGAVYLVVLTPPLYVERKTARLYAELTPNHYSSGEATLRLAAKLRNGGRPSAEDYVNVFDQVADKVFDGLDTYRHLLETLTGSRAMLAGAGPSLFAVVPGPPGRLGRWPQNSVLEQSGARAWTTTIADSGYGTRIASRPAG